MSEIKSRFSPFIKQCYVTCAVSLNIAGLGSTIGFPGVLLPQLHEAASPFNVSDSMESWITSVPAISTLVGIFMTPSVMARRGRKAAHYVAILPVLVSWLLIAFAPGPEWMLVARTLQGISFGMFMPLRSALIGEYTSPKNRGGFLTTVALSQAFGIFFVHLVGSLMSFQKTALIVMMFSIVSLLMMISSPESPSWLATQRRYDECRKVFIWLRGEDELSECEKMIEARELLDKHRDLRYGKSKICKNAIIVVKKKEFYKPILLMLTMNFMSQFAGGTLMASYSVTVIKLLLGPNVNAHLWMVGLDSQRIFFNVIAVYVINKTKRRTMMFATGALCAGSHLAMAVYVYARLNNWLFYDALWIPGLLINLQIFSLAMGMVPLPAVVAGEVFPLEYRSIGGSISMISVSGTIFLVLKTFPGLISKIGLHGTYAMFSGILALCLLVISFLLPETRGKTLQQIEEYFRGVPPAMVEDKEVKQMEENRLMDNFGWKNVNLVN